MTKELRFLGIIILSLFVQMVCGQEKGQKRELKRGTIIPSYVLCDGKKVPAVYCVRSIEYGVASLGYESYEGTAIDTATVGRVVVPGKVESPDGGVFRVNGVGRHAFADCRWLTEVVLPDSLHDIGDQSFMNCRSLRKIVLPAGTRYLWPYAFRGCINLQRIEVKAAVPPDSYNDVFDERTLRFATLVVPGEHADAYRSAFVWNMFRYVVTDWDGEK